MTVDLEEVAVALDAFPDWDEKQRAEVFHAIDVAPAEVLRDWEVSEYFSSESHAEWERIRTYVLKPITGGSWAVTLDEAASGEAAPTKEEILAALHRGERMIR